MQKRAKTIVFWGFVFLVLLAGASFASAAEVDWAQDGGTLLLGTAALSAATWIALSMAGGPRAATRFMAGALAISWLAETIGLQGGWLFGCFYRYHSGIWPVLPGGVPLFIPLAWVSLAGIPVMLLNGWKTARPDGTRDAAGILLKSALSAWGLAACDLTLDPVAVSLGLWSWERPGPYFGVPWLNFAGWWAVGFFVFLVGYGWPGPDRADEARLSLRQELAWGLAFGALLVLLGFGAFNRIGSLGPLWLSLMAMLPLSLFWLNRLHCRVWLRRPPPPAFRRGSIPREKFSTL